MTNEKKSKTSPESIVREIKRKTGRKFTAEEKIRIVLEGLRGEESITDLCRKEGIHPTMYYKSGNLEKAIEEYERIISLTYGRLDCGDIYAKSFYRLGKIYEQIDFKAKAIENYEKFLDLWKDADPGIAEVEDAQKRLAELQKE